ncbi:hypothetical protein [Pseudonocardia zijingensis]|uniref:Uncharacterized protein n=1 Tax=Pseudonocardia zijingensis TaxID=153376 RepID=A0ABN1P4C0_9PSEU
MSHPLEPERAPVMILVRRCLIALTVIGILATAFELASERHWNGLEQLVPWLALAVLVLATTLFLLPPGRRTVIIQVLAVVVLGASLYGVVDHVLANFHAGELDQRFADTWDSLPLVERGWYAVTKTVGPAPTLAPGVLGQTALLLLLATMCTGRRVPTTA